MSKFHVIIFLAFSLAVNIAATKNNSAKALGRSGTKYFSVSANAAYYEQAHQDCITLGAIPATIESPEDLKVVEKLLEGQDGARFWVGLKLRRSQRCIKPGLFQPDCWAWKGRNGDSEVSEDSENGATWSEDVNRKYQNKKSRGVILGGTFLLDIDDNTMTNRILCEVFDGKPEMPPTIDTETIAPTTAQPTTARSTTAQPTTARPTTAQPTTARPTTAQPTTARPTTAQPTTTQSVPCQPTINQPINTTLVLTAHLPTIVLPSTAQNPANLQCVCTCS